MEEVQYLKLIKNKLAGKKVCIFPMGIAGKSMADKLRQRGIEIDFFGDNNSALWGSTYQNKPCLSCTELLQMNQEELVVIVESLYYREIKMQLKEKGILNILRVYFEKIAAEEYVLEHEGIFEKQVENTSAILADERSREVYRHLINAWRIQDLPDDYFFPVYSKNQYFDEEIVKLTEAEVFVDGGAYIGDTADAFLQASKGRFEKMHLFELDRDIYKRLLAHVSETCSKWAAGGVIQCYPYGISEKRAKIVYLRGDSNSTIIENQITGNDAAIGEIRALDDVLRGERVTFIKMDIEGEEQNALKGAKHIIQEQKPKLAICMYHSPEDMLFIPDFIKKLVPEYQIYIRHHTDLMLETVCYAIPPDRL